MLDAIGLGTAVNNYVSPPSKEAVQKMLEAETDYSLEEDKSASENRPPDKASPLDAFLPVKKNPTTPKRNLVKYTFEETNDETE